MAPVLECQISGTSEYVEAACQAEKMQAGSVEERLSLLLQNFQSQLPGGRFHPFDERAS